jgi:hypothetical protein
MDLFNVQIVTVLIEKLHKRLPLRLGTFEIYCAPCGMDGQLWA